MFGIRSVLAKAIYSSGCWRAYRTGAMILFYHGIVETIRDKWMEVDMLSLKEFREQLDYLTKYRVVIPLSGLLRALAEGEVIDSRATVICFDDALANLTDYAVPELSARGMPFTVGVPAGLIDSGRSLWEYEASFLIYKLGDRVALDSVGRALQGLTPKASEFLNTPLPKKYSNVANGDNAYYVASRLKQFLRSNIQSDCRISVLDNLIQALRPDLRGQLEDDGRFRVMSWSQLRDVCATGGTLAAHGFLHHPHNTSITHSCQQAELSKPLELIRDQADSIVECFIWPEGVSSVESIRIGSDLGYKYFLTTKPGWINRDTPLVDVPRVSGQWPASQMLWNSAWIR